MVWSGLAGDTTKLCWVPPSQATDSTHQALAKVLRLPTASKDREEDDDDGHGARPIAVRPHLAKIACAEWPIPFQTRHAHALREDCSDRRVVERDVVDSAAEQELCRAGDGATLRSVVASKLLWQGARKRFIVGGRRRQRRAMEVTVERLGSRVLRGPPVGVFISLSGESPRGACARAPRSSTTLASSSAARMAPSSPTDMPVPTEMPSPTSIHGAEAAPHVAMACQGTRGCQESGLGAISVASPQWGPGPLRRLLAVETRRSKRRRLTASLSEQSRPPTNVRFTTPKRRSTNALQPKRDRGGEEMLERCSRENAPSASLASGHRVRIHAPAATAGHRPPAAPDSPEAVRHETLGATRCLAYTCTRILLPLVR